MDDRFLYQQVPVILLSPGHGQPLQSYWQRFLQEAADDDFAISFRAPAQVVIVTYYRGGTPLKIHYAVYTADIEGSAQGLWLQPLSAWQRGVGDQDERLADPASVGPDLIATADHLRRAAERAAS